MTHERAPQRDRTRAQQAYGDAARWPRIFEANRDQLFDPDLIFPGQRLRVPT